MQSGLVRRARARWMVVAGVLTAGALFAGGCDLRHELVAPETPGVIDPSAVAGPTGANGLRIGAIGSLKLATGSGETIWQLGGLLADEWKSASASSATNEIDRRVVSTNNTSVTAAYNAIQQSRGYYRDAIQAMRTFIPDSLLQIGELYFGLGFLEMQLAENFCNGIPFGQTVNGVPVYGASNTDAAVFGLASAHLDTALTLVTSTTAIDTATVRIQNQVRVAKGRVLIDIGGQSTAAATVVAAVPTAFQYTFTFSNASGLNGNWNLNSSQSLYTLGDSVDAAGRIANAIPFVSLNDVRVPRANPNKTGVDGVTPLFTQSIWANNGQIPVVSGIDARLIEAEARLQANDIPGMTGILNTLRTTAQTMGTFKPVVLIALATPANQAAATATLFREKAFWTFGRGQRLGDLRRQVRQYATPAANVGPSGIYLKGGAYGGDLNFPVPDAERANPLFTGCIDRNP